MGVASYIHVLVNKWRAFLFFLYCHSFILSLTTSLEFWQKYALNPLVVDCGDIIPWVVYRKNFQ